jgi:hypothetical protein
VDIEFKNRQLHTLLDHWIEARRGRAVPFRSDIDPSAFPKVIPHAWIYRLHDDGEFYCVLAGEEVSTAYQRTLIGRSASEVLGADYSWLRERWLYLMRKPAFLFVSQRRQEDQGRVFERLIFPVADNDGQVRQVLGAASYVSRDSVPLFGPVMHVETGILFDAATLEPLPFDELPGPETGT